MLANADTLFARLMQTALAPLGDRIELPPASRDLAILQVRQLSA